MIDWGSICCDVDAVLVCRGEERALLEGKGVDLPIDLIFHLTYDHELCDQKNGIMYASGRNELPLKGGWAQPLGKGEELSQLGGA